MQSFEKYWHQQKRKKNWSIATQASLARSVRSVFPDVSTAIVIR